MRSPNLPASLLAVSVALFSCSGEENSNSSANSNPAPDADVNNTPDSDMGAGDIGGDMTTPDGIRLPTLSTAVDVKYDEDGILHVTCATDRDCFVAEGYFHARDRFVQMDFARHQTHGTLSTVVGHLLAKDSDVYWRHIMATDEGDPLAQEYFNLASDSTKDMFEAYAEGVNAWLADLRAERNDARLSAEYSSGLLYGPQDIRDWEPADSVTLYLQLGFQFAYGKTNVTKAKVVQDIGLAAASDYVSPYAINWPMETLNGPNTLLRPPREQRTPDVSRLEPFFGTFGRASARIEENRSLLFGSNGAQSTASNATVVGPTRTVDGNTILMNDPHLDMTNPALWYIVHLRSQENLHVAGASVAGVPGLIIGQNERIAWGVTVNMYQMADAYAETLTPDGNAVMFNGEPVDIIRRDIEFPGRDGAMLTDPLEWVRGHGPIIDKDVDAGVATTLKWAAHTPGPDIDFLADLLRAQSVAEADVALEPVRVLNINWTVADVEGNIAWLPKGQLPNRPYISDTQPWWFPVPGDGSSEWGDVPHDSDDYHRIVNPAQGFIHNSNTDLDDRWLDGDPFNEGLPHTWAQQSEEGPNRQQRAMQLLEAQEKHDLDSMLAIQADAFSRYGELIVPHLLAGLAPVRDQLTPTAEAVAAALDTWDFNCPTGLEGFDMEASPVVSDAAIVASATGCSAFHGVLLQTGPSLTTDQSPDERSLGWLFSAFVLSRVYLDPASSQLGADGWFDNGQTPQVETEQDFLLQMFELAATFLTEEIFDSADPTTWIWGRVHGAALPSLSTLPAYALGPVATPGGYATLAKANPPNRNISALTGTTDGFHHTDGPSIGIVYELDDTGVRARFRLPGGQVHSDVDSPLYDNLLQKWLELDYTVIPFTQEDADAAPAYWEATIDK